MAPITFYDCGYMDLMKYKSVSKLSLLSCKQFDVNDLN